MSKRRMFSQSIVESDAFLDMPQTSQNLYFHLGMNADDDGFVNPKRIVRMVGAGQDDLQVLVAKRFILLFESGVAVVKHWPTNNFIRTDRYRPTPYKNELGKLTHNENGDYTEISQIYNKALKTHGSTFQENTTNDTQITGVVNHSDTNGIPDGRQTVYPSKVKLSKVRLSKATNNPPGFATTKPDKVPTETIDAMLALWHERTGLVIGNETSNRRAIASLLRQMDKEKLCQLIEGVRMSLDDRYAPRIGDFVALKRKMNDLLIWGRKYNQQSTGRGFKVT